MWFLSRRMTAIRRLQAATAELPIFSRGKQPVIYHFRSAPTTRPASGISGRKIKDNKTLQNDSAGVNSCPSGGSLKVSNRRKSGS
jgi:hypothetical protein